MRTACEDRGADLFLLARDGAEPGPAMAAHLAACDGCREELVHLRRLAGALPDASGRLRPRPSTKTDLMKEVAAVLAAESAGEEEAPPPPRRRGPLLTLWVPVGAVAASFLITAFVLTRNGTPPHAVESSGPVDVRPVFGGTALDGLLPTGLSAGSELHARDVASVRLGPPFGAEVVLGKGAGLRLPGREGRGEDGDRTLVLIGGAAWFSPGPGNPLTVRAGEVVASGSAPFAVESRAGGVVTVIVESGEVAVAAAGTTVPARGPCRVEVEPGRPPGEPIPAEASDATGWFAHPDLRISFQGEGEGRELLLTLSPSVPRTIPIAPWNRFDPLFTLQLTNERGLQRNLPLPARALRRPAPPTDGDGSFLLSPDRLYRLHLDPSMLGLRPGRYSLVVLYAANRSGGPWRGTRASNGVDLVIE